jgi:hypothetical protein
MKKVIALNENENGVLTTRVNAEKNYWCITHNLEVNILPSTLLSSNTSIEPEVGNIMEGTNNRFYKILKSQKVLICTICEQKANFKIGYRFYCKKHYKHLILTKPIRRNIIQPNRNELCSCGSGQKFKNCCISKLDHKPLHYFKSLSMEDPRIVNSLKTTVN